MEYAKFMKILNEKLQNPDEALKQKLLKAPKETIKELVGEDIPGNVTVHTPKEKTLTFVIPYEGKLEMSADDLSEVSGGAKDYPFNNSIWRGNIAMYACPSLSPQFTIDKQLIDRLNNKGDEK